LAQEGLTDGLVVIVAATLVVQRCGKIEVRGSPMIGVADMLDTLRGNPRWRVVRLRAEAGMQHRGWLGSRC
jgi:hypothetical protein